MEQKNLRLTTRHRLRFTEADASAVMPGNGNQSNALALSKQNLIKKSMLLLVALLIFTSVVLKAQSPQKINFQSIVRNTSGVIVSNKSVKFKITILADSTKGIPVYSETHLKTTDAIGLVSLQIGSGTVTSGVFSSLNWGNASHFIKLEADFTGGNTYVPLGTQELMSVPYAMYAAKTDTASLNLTNRFAEKAPVNNPTFTGTVGGITKAMVDGLENVNNTTDAGKPVSTATQTALDTKLNKSDFPRGNSLGEFLYWNGDRWTSLEPGQPGQSIILDQNRNPTWGCIIPSSVGTAPSPTLTVNTLMTPITIATTGVTGILTQNLPEGLEATWSANVITISGIPTLAIQWNYLIVLGVSCGNPLELFGKITVSPCTPNTAGTPSSPTVTVNSLMTPIKIATTGATGIDPLSVGLPPGVTATWSANVITISGTPTESGTFTYFISLTGGCGEVNATGTITVTPAVTVPDAPTNVVATAGDGSASVAFEAPSNNGGSDISGYYVQVTPINSPIPFGPGATSPITVTGLTNGTEYTFRVVAINGEGPSNLSAPSNAVTPVAAASACPTTVEDIDNNIYNTVSIGNQCWTKTNLKVTKYNDNTSIPLVTSGTWAVTTGAYTIYDNEASIGPNATKYGFLYNWYAVTDVKKICPTGWHVPTDSDWNKLVKFIDSAADTSSTSEVQSTTAGTELKKNDALWTTNTGTNTSGFSALPGGYRSSNGGFIQISNLALSWSATENDNNNNNAWFRTLFGSSGDVERFANDKSFGASVRCLRD